MGVIFINPYRFGGFDPLSLSPALWLDASDTSTITSSSGAVSQWDDKSGNGRHVTQATGANQPTTGSATQNGRNVLTFSGSQDLKRSAFAVDADLTIVSVFKVTSATTFTMPGLSLSSSNLARPVDRWHSSTQNVFIISDILAGSGVANLRTWTTFASWSATYSKTTSTTPRIVEYANNVQQTTLNSLLPHNVTTQKLCVGRRDDAATTLNGQIAEIMIFAKILSLSERSDLHTYLATKWAL